MEQFPERIRRFIARKLVAATALPMPQIRGKNPTPFKQVPRKLNSTKEDLNLRTSLSSELLALLRV